MNSIISPICNDAIGSPRHSVLNRKLDILADGPELVQGQDIPPPSHYELETTYTHGPSVLPPGLSRSLPFSPFSVNAFPTYGTARTDPTNANKENPILACKAGNSGRDGNGIKESIESGNKRGRRGCMIRVRAMGGRV